MTAAVHSEFLEVLTMIDHVTLNVTDMARSRNFYEKALAPLGYSVLGDYGDFVGLGREGKPDFWLARRDPVGTAFHVAITANDYHVVHAFHDAAIAAGGTDNGKAGPRPDYGSTYYGAFVLDPDGNNIEAVCHVPV